MNLEQFWRLIDESRNATPSGNNQVAFLDKSIRVLPPQEMVSFEGHCWDLLSTAYLRELWAVATIIQPSCTAASFDALRGWMVLQGKEFFERVTAEPQRLADALPRGRIAWYPEGEMLLRLIPRIYRNATGEDLPTIPRKVPSVLKGQRWSEFDLPELFPELWKKYRS